jgi:hypothetical protein
MIYSHTGKVLNQILRDKGQMMSAYKRLALIFSLTITAIGQSSVINASPLSCVEKYNLYTQAQINWQNDSAEIAIKLLPDHIERINQYKTVQLIAIERRKLAVNIAFDHFPERVSHWGSINQWIDLSPELEAELIQHSPEFETLTAEYNQLISKPAEGANNDFHHTFRKAVLSDPNFLKLMSDFDGRSRELNSLSCDA